MQHTLIMHSASSQNMLLPRLPLLAARILNQDLIAVGQQFNLDFTRFTEMLLSAENYRGLVAFMERILDSIPGNQENKVWGVVKESMRQKLLSIMNDCLLDLTLDADGRLDLYLAVTSAQSAFIISVEEARPFLESSMAKMQMAYGFAAIQ